MNPNPEPRTPNLNQEPNLNTNREGRTEKCERKVPPSALASDERLEFSP